MLQQMRSGAKSIVIKFILFGLLMLATLGLAVMDVQGMFRNGVKQNYVAKVDGDKLTTVEFDRMVRMELQNRNVKQSDALQSGIPQQVLAQEINGRIFAKASHDAGIVVDDASAAREIKKIIKPLTDKGMAPKDALAQALRTFGLSEGQLVHNIKLQMATDLLLKTITDGAEAPQQMVDDALKFKNEWRAGQYFTLTAADAGKLPAASDSDLLELYKSMSSDFMLPETRSFAVVTLDKKALGVEEAKVTDADIKAYYDSHKESYAAPVTRTIEQIIVKDEETAKKAYADAQSAGFDKAAANAKTKVVSGNFGEKDLPDELAPAFKAEIGKPMAPVESPLGWHVLLVKKEIPANVKPLEAVKAKIAQDLAANNNAFYDKANELDDKIASGKSVADIAREYSLTEKVFDKVDAKGMDAAGHKADMPMADKVLASVFALDKGETSQLIEMQGGGFIIAEVREVNRAQPEPFEKVRASVEKEWQKRKTAEALNDKAGKIIDQIKLGGSFDKAAAEAGKPIQQIALVKRGATGTGLPQGMLPALFSLDKTGQAISVPDEGKVSILRLTERKLDKPKAETRDELESLQALLKRSMQNDLVSQYRQSLMARYNVKINDDLVLNMYAPKADSDTP